MLFLHVLVGTEIQERTHSFIGLKDLSFGVPKNSVWNVKCPGILQARKI